MPEIRNVSDWWAVVDKQWGFLIEIIAHHMDLRHPAYEVPGKADSPATGRTIAVEIEHLKAARDRRLCRYFAATWCLASEAYAWSVPGWGALCDLCSEEWVFNEQETEKEPNQ